MRGRDPRVLIFSAILAVTTAGLLVESALGQRPSLRKQSWFDRYEEGVRKVEEGLRQRTIGSDPVWKEAVALLQQSIGQEVSPGRAKTVRGRKEKYFPYFYLGIAYLRQGRLNLARRELERCRSFGEASRDRRHRNRLPVFESILYYELAIELYNRDDLRGAKSSLARAREIGKIPRQFRSLILDYEKKVFDGLTERRRRFDELRKTIDASLTGGRVGPALDQLKTAKARYPVLFREAGLDAVMRTTRARVPRKAATAVPRPARNGLRTGGLLLLQGRTRAAIEALEKNGLGNDIRTRVLLGVSYAKLALVSDPAGYPELNAKAMQHFDSVLAEQPRYRLPGWVPPVVIALFEGRKSNR